MGSSDESLEIIQSKQSNYNTVVPPQLSNQSYSMSMQNPNQMIPQQMITTPEIA